MRKWIWGAALVAAMAGSALAQSQWGQQGQQGQQNPWGQQGQQQQFPQGQPGQQQFPQGQPGQQQNPWAQQGQQFPQGQPGQQQFPQGQPGQQQFPQGQPGQQQFPQGQQQASLVGQWYCEWGFQNTAPGQPANAIGGSFNMVLYQNGTAQGQGVDMGSAGQFPMQFQANWQVQGRAFQLTGRSQGGMQGGVAQFQFTSNMNGPGQMALTQRYQNGQVYASACQRTG
ncbi:MAG: hypothetical protein AAF674_07395 [Pseudomonadota bacterium]